MSYFVYPWSLEQLQGRPPYMDGECVALVQALPGIGHTSGWRPGPRVVDQLYLNPGTVIANFEFKKDGTVRFPNKHGYHAALFIEFGGRGVSSGRATSIHVMDQWRGRSPNIVGRREILGRGKSRIEGNAYRDSDNADQFYVVAR